MYMAVLKSANRLCSFDQAPSSFKTSPRTCSSKTISSLPLSYCRHIPIVSQLLCKSTEPSQCHLKNHFVNKRKQNELKKCEKVGPIIFLYWDSQSPFFSSMWKTGLMINFFFIQTPCRLFISIVKKLVLCLHFPIVTLSCLFLLHSEKVDLMIAFFYFNYQSPFSPSFWKVGLKITFSYCISQSPFSSPLWKGLCSDYLFLL